MGTLATTGGRPVRTAPFHPWPVWDRAEEQALLKVLRSGKWWRFASAHGVELAEPEKGERSEVVLFQEEFARAHDCRYALAAANGTGTLEVGIRAMRLGLPRERFLKALEAEGVPCFSGYTFPLYRNPMFLRRRFINGSFPLGTQYHADLDYASFAAKCPVAERACASEAVWLAQNLFLGTEVDIDDIARAVRKVVENRKELA